MHACTSLWPSCRQAAATHEGVAIGQHGEGHRVAGGDGGLGAVCGHHAGGGASGVDLVHRLQPGSNCCFLRGCCVSRGATVRGGSGTSG